ncbi:amino acid/amide ABC transporter substrate-binding protein, HAAT family [Devosia lucknowensis]|uniref:Amino acid/amide ABC transporter substrate-binding protein, HAAT family n=1 Tax=Devosia lucknowensis TaxID=1096929 RepID=A0A1Y6G6Z8_9HYPH|nr:penicillin-binding protein activator [Devosia lucknowensis]SMQ85942.1 amino acid/amide ABC transporter substrate-binding protein, HAAT family [Devosia lucknowensis]
MVRKGETATRWTRRSVMTGLAALVAACSPGSLQLGSRSFSFPWDSADQTGGAPLGSAAPTMPSQRIGRGSVTVALLLPLSGDPAVAQLGVALANAARLAIQFIEANANIAENITLSLRDTGTGAAGAVSAANAAVAEGAKLVLGPLTAEQISAAAAVTRAANIPMIGFANNGSVAGPNVYVLNVLPETEMKRALTWLREQGRRGPAGIFPSTPYGEALASAFRTQAIAAGFNPSAVYTFSDVSEAQGIINQAKPLVERMMLDALFVPDRATAPTFAGLLAQAGVARDDVQLVGSADWSADPQLATNAALVGAVFPGVDDAGLNAIRADYQRQFGAAPPQMATIAYTAVILANVNTLSKAVPPYSAQLLTNPSGFAGRDGLFRFQANGRSDYALAIKQIGAGGVVTTVDAAKI